MNQILNCSEVVGRNIAWFRNSGIMRPADGFWGVAERIVLLEGNEAVNQINKTFPSQTVLRPGVAALEHRRADCTLETALMFDLAADALGDDSLRAVADNLIEFLTDRSALRNRDKDSPDADLWGWALLPGRTSDYWCDDNAWMATLFLILARRGRKKLMEPGLAAARTLLRQASGFMEHIAGGGMKTPPPSNPPYRTCARFAPHWMGLVTMALAHGAKAAPELDWLTPMETYYRFVLEGPPEWDRRYPRPVEGKPAWPMTEYGYLAMTGAIAAAQSGSDLIARVARQAADLLVDRQADDGHIPSLGAIEAPAGAELSDLVYTDNWAALAFYHAWRAFGDERYRAAFERILAFLAGIQDRSGDPIFDGCWRGMYDTRAKRWGGGDRYEGGCNSIYSGWTNAPIAWSFLFEMTGGSLLADSALINQCR